MLSLLNNNKKNREKALRKQAENIQIVVSDFSNNKENNIMMEPSKSAKCLAFNDKIEYSNECLNNEVIM